MKREDKIIVMRDRLTELYPDSECTLNYDTPFKLLVATQLAAQCTDARVNIVTKTLFKKYPTVESFAAADQKELEEDIKSTGFYHNKRKTSSPVQKS